MKKGVLLKNIFLLIILVMFSLTLTNNVKSQGDCKAVPENQGGRTVCKVTQNNCNVCYAATPKTEPPICTCTCEPIEGCNPISPPSECYDKCPDQNINSIYYYYPYSPTCVPVLSEICDQSKQCNQSFYDCGGSPLICNVGNVGKLANPWTWSRNAPTTEQGNFGNGCTDGYDNDCDGLVDNNDPDCGCILQKVELSGVLCPFYGTSSDCEKGDPVAIIITYTGQCAGTKYIQVDANDTSIINPSCNVTKTGGDISGVFGSLSMTNTLTPQTISTNWIVPDITNDCLTKRVYPRNASLYNNPNYIPGSYVSGTNNLAGNFKFAGAISDTCSDTDSGITYPTQGTITGNYNSIGYSYTDFCVGNSDTLREYYCNGNINASQTHNCVSDGLVCQNGACVSSSQTCTPDNSDGGDIYRLSYRPAYFKAGVTINPGNVVYNDTCSNGILKEYKCNGNNTVFDTYICPFGCKDPFTCKVDCSDTDLPTQNYTIKGTAYGVKSKYILIEYFNTTLTDSCISSTNLNEIYCNSTGFLSESSFDCASIGMNCVDGACQGGGDCYSDPDNFPCDQLANKVCCNQTGIWGCTDVNLCIDPGEPCPGTCCSSSQTCSGNVIANYTCGNGETCCPPTETCDTYNYYSPDVYDVEQVGRCSENPINSGIYLQTVNLTTYDLTANPPITNMLITNRTCSPLPGTKIPFFTTLNIILVIIVLVSFYLIRKRINKS